MFPMRLIRNPRVGTLICDGNHFRPCGLHRNCVAVSSFLSRTVQDYHSNLDLVLSVRSPQLNKSVKSFSSESGGKCWKCNENVETFKFSCANCGVLQRPNPKMTYFQLLHLAENFDLDSDDISSKYKALQKVFHPDKFVQKSKEEIDISDDYSRLVNKAYSTLKNPLERGMYMLNLKGLKTDDDSVKMKQDFLMEILEKNEEVEKLNDEKSILEFQKINSNIVSEYVKNASKAFQKNDLQEAREILMKMKYYVNIDNELKKKKSAMGIVE